MNFDDAVLHTASATCAKMRLVVEDRNPWMHVPEDICAKLDDSETISRAEEIVQKLRSNPDLEQRVLVSIDPLRERYNSYRQIQVAEITHHIQDLDQPDYVTVAAQKLSQAIYSETFRIDPWGVCSHTSDAMKQMEAVRSTTMALRWLDTIIERRKPQPPPPPKRPRGRPRKVKTPYNSCTPASPCPAPLLLSYSDPSDQPNATSSTHSDQSTPSETCPPSISSIPADNSASLDQSSLPDPSIPSIASIPSDLSMSSIPSISSIPSSQPAVITTSHSSHSSHHSHSSHTHALPSPLTLQPSPFQLPPSPRKIRN